MLQTLDLIIKIQLMQQQMRQNKVGFPLEAKPLQEVVLRSRDMNIDQPLNFSLTKPTQENSGFKSEDSSSQLAMTREFSSPFLRAAPVKKLNYLN